MSRRNVQEQSRTYSANGNLSKNNERERKKEMCAANFGCHNSD
jgi:hypothetical protein